MDLIKPLINEIAKNISSRDRSVKITADALSDNLAFNVYVDGSISNDNEQRRGFQAREYTFEWVSQSEKLKLGKNRRTLPWSLVCDRMMKHIQDIAKISRKSDGFHNFMIKIMIDQCKSSDPDRARTCNLPT